MQKKCNDGFCNTNNINETCRLFEKEFVTLQNEIQKYSIANHDYFH